MESTRRILAIVVLYKMTFDQSPSVSSLLKAISEDGALAKAIDLMVCDNTPYEQAVPANFSGRFYRDLTNPGLAHWYNVALRTAEQNGIPWLLRFDQDTEVTASYIAEVLAQTAALEEDRQIVAMVPKLVQNGIVCSPLTPPTYRHPRPFDKSFTGVATSELRAFNSGSILRVSALKDTGGFPEDFPLDFLDYATFTVLQSRGGRLFVLDSILKHDLSSNNVRRTDTVAVAQHRGTLIAERKFYKLYGSALDRVYRRIRLLRGAMGVLLRHGAVARSFRMMKAALD